MTHHTFIRGLLEHLYSIDITKKEILAVLNQSGRPSPIIVTRALEIKIEWKELTFTPAQRVLYLLLLRHPEGICQKDMSDYREELTELFFKVKGFISPMIGRTIDHLCNPLHPCCNEVLSQIRRKIRESNLNEVYIPTIGKGEFRKVEAEVVFEMDI